MLRREFLAAVGSVVAIWTRGTVAQSIEMHRKKLPRVGMLTSVSPLRYKPVQDAFDRGLRELGYIEDQNVFIDRRFWNSEPNILSKFVGELVANGVDVIVAPSTIEAVAAKKATSTIPIVTITADAVSAGLAENLAHPGGNVTGMAAAEIDKQLPLLAEALPQASIFAILINPDNPVHAHILPHLMEAAAHLSRQLLFVEKRGVNDIEPAFATMVAKKAQALVVLSDAVTFANHRRIIELAAQYRIPAIYTWREEAIDGGLLAYGPDVIDLTRRSAAYVVKLLQGAKAAELPIEKAERLYLVINLKAAAALDVKIPPSLLVSANEVIE
jgi:putative ABC transport system substrate-binding protein